MIRSASPFSHGVGSSSGSSPGSGVIGAWQRTSRPPSTRRAHSSTPPPSCFSSAASLAPHDFRNRLLEMVRHILEYRGMLGATYLITECAVRRYTDRQPIGHLGN